MKTAKQLERYFKGAANHRRLEILFVIAKNEAVIRGVGKDVI